MATQLGIKYEVKRLNNSIVVETTGNEIAYETIDAGAQGIGALMASDVRSHFDGLAENDTFTVKLLADVSGGQGVLQIQLDAELFASGGALTTTVAGKKGLPDSDELESDISSALYGSIDSYLSGIASLEERDLWITVE